MWVNRQETGFHLSQEGTLPSGAQAISFADINRDGTIDLIFPTCSRVTSSGVGTDCYINVAYNQQLPLCTLATESGMKKGVRYCRRPEDLCTADMNFKFNLTDSPDNHVITLFSPLKRHSH
jgi:integrin alpha FG-GAP repeat containing protein 1